MKFNPKKYFVSTSSERRGFVVLVILLLLALSFFFVKQYIYEKAPKLTITYTELEEIKELEEKETTYQKELVKEKITLFQFNPNEISQKEWQNLGFSEKQAQSIIKFRSKGFEFKQKSDLKKLYVVDDKKYQQLKPFIILPKQNIKKEQYQYRILLLSSKIPVYNGLEDYGQVFYKKNDSIYKYYSVSFSDWNSANQQLEAINAKGNNEAFITKLPSDFHVYPIKQKKKNYKKAIPKVIELNSADTTALKKLKGIGSYYANKIIKYRERLGGFYAINQLKEVYGIKPEIIEKNKAFINIDSTLVHKINVNTATKEELKQHPYIKWNVANSIVLYRINHGDYKTVQNIQNSDLVNDELYRKIVKYLTVE